MNDRVVGGLGTGGDDTAPKRGGEVNKGSSQSSAIPYLDDIYTTRPLGSLTWLCNAPGVSIANRKPSFFWPNSENHEPVAHFLQSKLRK